MSIRASRWALFSIALGSALLSSIAFSSAPLKMNQANAQTPPARLEQTPTERILSVTGEGRQRIPTTLTEIRLGVAIEAASAQAAQAQVAERQSRVVEFLRSRSVQRLETTAISLNPRYDFRNDTQQLRGYLASNTLSFRLPTEQAGDVLDQAIAAGATTVESVSFVAEDSAIADAQQQALTAAVADAQRQADTVLSALGLTRQDVASITIGTASPPPVTPQLARAEASAFDTSTPIIGQSLTVERQVTLYIRY